MRAPAAAGRPKPERELQAARAAQRAGGDRRGLRERRAVSGRMAGREVREAWGQQVLAGSFQEVLAAVRSQMEQWVWAGRMVQAAWVRV